LYSCLTGVAFDGPKKGTRLRPVATLPSDWGFWLKQYPGAVAYYMFEKYQPVEAGGKRAADSQESRNAADGRLPPDSMVLGVYQNGEARAYPLGKSFKTESIADGPRVIFQFGPTQTVVAYLPTATPPEKVV